LQQVELAPWHNGLLNELLLTLPVEGTWEEMLSRVEAKMQESKSSFAGARTPQITLHLGTRTVFAEEMERLLRFLQEKYALITVGVVATDLTTQEAARRFNLNVYMMQPGSLLISAESETTTGNNALYLPNTIRSGQRIVHPGTVIIGGDVNAGAEVIADGDIVVFGTLRGLAHAGFNGNEEARISAGNMRPQQLRIATKMARAPEDNSPSKTRITEVARIENGEITVVPYGS
jgi:septum site-determining protein MinC